MYEALSSKWDIYIPLLPVRVRVQYKNTCGRLGELETVDICSERAFAKPDNAVACTCGLTAVTAWDPSMLGPPLAE